MPERMARRARQRRGSAVHIAGLFRLLPRLRQTFSKRVRLPQAYPFECGHCAVCDWDETCKKQRREDDHLSLVAWMRRDQIAKLTHAGISTIELLGRTKGATEVKGSVQRRFRISNSRHGYSSCSATRSTRETLNRIATTTNYCRSDPKRGLACFPSRTRRHLFRHGGRSILRSGDRSRVSLRRLHAGGRTLSGRIGLIRSPKKSARSSSS